ncbi:MAG TPA: hypothetical protein DCS93_08095 [Microscillaceae bacterium]|nr:hypothetical protein [Microscillaceae bacterium]
MRKILWSLVVFWAISGASCKQQKGPGEAANTKIPLSQAFDQSTSNGVLENDQIDEASGLVASRNNVDAFWTHNDSGGKSKLFLLDGSGRSLGVFKLKGIKARDWEDITLGPGPKEGVNYLYIGEIGDNRAQYDEKKIYRLPEPKVNVDGEPVRQTIDKQQIETIRFKYPDGNRDAEAMMIDPVSKNIYIVTKREERVRVYVASYPQSTTEVNTLQRVGTLDLHKIVAGDISPDGKEVLLKDYGNIYYWKKSGNESIEELLKTTPKRVPYVPEPQGEAIAWGVKGEGFYTLSEERHNVPAELYFYRRK